MKKAGARGVLVIDKPEGPSSHDVVLQVRRELRTKIGHTGTLDPLASGVLPLVLGQATRLARFFQSSDKAYEGVVRLGVATDTYDREGRVTERHDVEDVSSAEVERVLERFTGALLQRPPLFSAIKVRGERLYKAARRGEKREIPSRTVQVYELQILDRQGEDWRLKIRCSAGTYIRSLAHDLGQELGVGAHLRSLRRTESGPFSLEDAVALEEVGRCWRDALIPMEDLLTDWPRIELSEDAARKVRNGVRLEAREEWKGLRPVAADSAGEEDAGMLRLFCESRLVGLGIIEGGLLVPKMVVDVSRPQDPR